MIKLLKTTDKMPDSIFKSISVGRAGELLKLEHFKQFKMLQEELEFEYVRFHGLFHDELGIVIRDDEGKIRYRWQEIDKVFDSLKAINIRPLVELGAMPVELASEDITIFRWNMNVSKPKDYNEWYDLVFAFVSHMVDRYGLKEVEQWRFEVWNEPNIKGFWPYDMDEYYKLYTYSAKAVKAVSETLKVGGPATAGGAYIKETIDFCTENDVPLDFVSTHAYPVGDQCEYPDRAKAPYETGRYIRERFKEVQEIVKNSNKPELEIHWTEWNTQSAKSKSDIDWDLDPSLDLSWSLNPTVDLHFGASSVAKEMLSVMNYCDSVAYWVVSDFFEEYGAKLTPYSCTYGMITRDGIKKATYNAYKFLRNLRGNLYKAEVEKEPPMLCDVCVTEENGIFRGVLYNHKELDVENQPDFKDTLCFDVEDGEYIATFATIKEHQGSAYETWLDMGYPDNLSEIQLEMLKAHSTPEYRFEILNAKNNKVEFPFCLKPNEVMYVELQKKAPKGYLGAEKDKGASHLRSLLK